MYHDDMSAAPLPPIERLSAIREAFPSEGLFAEKSWRLSPEAFPLSKALVRRLESLGNSLYRFQRAQNDLYFRSVKGESAPSWIADYLDAGKPADLLGTARAGKTRDFLPKIIRPDLILTENEGFAMSELDSVPGGIGLTGWLGQTYADLDPSVELVGGRDGMVEGFRSIFPPEGDVTLAVSEESADYRPEMKWLANQLGERFTTSRAEDLKTEIEATIYRFFELFDLPNLPSALTSRSDLTPPLKPWLEEKAWLALFWSRPLRELWRRELRDSHFKKLQEIVPFSWIVDPAELPHHAVIPRLELADFAELKDLSQTERDLVLKISGFSEIAWGSRSVNIGADQSQDEWSQAVDNALNTFEDGPWVLQEFHKGTLVEHPYFDDTGEIVTMTGRVRLCPYYFVNSPKDIRLGGVLATIVPADKKIIHGMSDAIIVPCRVEE